MVNVAEILRATASMGVRFSPSDFGGGGIQGRLSPQKFIGRPMRFMGATGLFQMPRNAVGIDVDFDPTVGIIQREFNQLSGDIRSFREPLKRAIQQVMAPSFQKNFDVGGRPPWAPLSEYALQRRRDEGFGGKILVKTGRLRRVAGQLSIWTIDGQQGRAVVHGLPSRVWYGRLHQQGADVGFAAALPARPFIVAQREDLDAVQDVFADYIQERIDRGLRLRPGMRGLV